MRIAVELGDLVQHALDEVVGEAGHLTGQRRRRPRDEVVHAPDPTARLSRGGDQNDRARTHPEPDRLGSVHALVQHQGGEQDRERRVERRDDRRHGQVTAVGRGLEQAGRERAEEAAEQAAQGVAVAGHPGGAEGHGHDDDRPTRDELVEREWQVVGILRDLGQRGEERAEADPARMPSVRPDPRSPPSTGSRETSQMAGSASAMPTQTSSSGRSPVATPTMTGTTTAPTPETGATTPIRPDASPR